MQGAQRKERSRSGAGAGRSLSPPSGRSREQMERRCENSRVGVGKYVTAQTPEGGKSGQIDRRTAPLHGEPERGGGRMQELLLRGAETRWLASPECYKCKEVCVCVEQHHTDSALLF